MSENVEIRAVVVSPPSGVELWIECNGQSVAVDPYAHALTAENKRDIATRINDYEERVAELRSTEEELGKRLRLGAELQAKYKVVVEKLRGASQAMKEYPSLCSREDAKTCQHCAEMWEKIDDIDGYLSAPKEASDGKVNP